MKNRISFFLSTARILARGFFCGLIIVPVSWFLLRSLLLQYAQHRSMPHFPPGRSLAWKTKRGLIVPIPTSSRLWARAFPPAEKGAYILASVSRLYRNVSPQTTSPNTQHALVGVSFAGTQDPAISQE